MEIDRNSIPLTDQEEMELVGHINQAFMKAQGLSRTDMWKRCFDAYNQKFRRNLSKTESWQRGIRLFMPIMRQMVSTMKSALVQFMFPSDDNYISVEASPDVAEFWSEAVLHNFSRTGWMQNSHKAVGQAAITGDNWTAVFPSRENPVFVTAPSLSVFDINVTPLSEELTDSTKIMQLKMPEWKLRTSPFGYFNLDKLRDRNLDNTSLQPWEYNQVSMNPGDRGVNEPMGEGHLLYQAYIHYYKFPSSKREITNFVATVAVSPSILIRFEPQEPGFDPFIKTPWEQTDSPSIFWGVGVVEPSLSINSYINTLMTMDMVETMLSAMGIYTYNQDDKTSHSEVMAGNWQVGPAKIWAHGSSGPPQVLQRAPRTGKVEELFFILKNELTDMVGAHPIFSGSGSGVVDPTATLSNIRAQGSNSKAVRIAMHWDESYTKPVVYRVIKNIQQTFKQEIGQVLGPDGQPAIATGINFEVIQFWLNAIGMDPETKLQDTRFLQELLEPIEMSQIKVTGSQTLNNRLQTQQNLNNAVEILSKTPANQYMLWDQIARRVLEVNNIKNVDELIVDSQQILQQLEQQIQQIQQILQSGVNPQTGQPLSPEEFAQGQQQLQQLVQEYQARSQGQQPGPPLQQLAQPQIQPPQEIGSLGPTEREQMPT